MKESSFYNSARKFYLENINLEPIVADLEQGFHGTGPTDLRNYAEAKSFYEMLLENMGDICANFIAPRANIVDEKGASYTNGDVQWAPETKENMEVLKKSGLLCGTLPRKYGGLNLPTTINNLFVEMVSQADASLMNIFGLQDIAVTICKFATEEQKNRILPRFTSGEVTGSMALTEPDAGSDLQAVNLKAIEKEGKWYLDGVKRFITNGCAEISLVLARSEENLKGGRGLSMYIYERDSRMTIRRIEEKLGIHGSPTCELQFNMAPAELVGKRKFGLIKYVMSLMDGARLGVSAQAIGIAQAAYDEAVKYANAREQFGKPIVQIPAVYQMLKSMQVELETTRALLLHTSLAVDYMDMYERKFEHGEDVRNELKHASAMAGFLTPLLKFTATEMANKVAYDSLQIHGGCGYMKDFAVERLYRDARITNIYEGTTQLQVVAAIGGILNNLFKAELEKVTSLPIEHLQKSQTKIVDLAKHIEYVVEEIKLIKAKDFVDFVANYVVEMASIVYRAYLMLPIADKHPEKRDLFEYFLREGELKIGYLSNRISSLQREYGENIESLGKDFLLD